MNRDEKNTKVKEEINNAKFGYRITGISQINDKNIREEVFNDELVSFQIVDREDQIDHLITWIAEAKPHSSDIDLMKSDLKMLMGWDDKYILSSIETNEYYRESEKEGQKILKEIYNV